MSDAGHSNNFDFVRLAAALCVVVSHQFALNGLPEPALFNVHSLGGLGVLIFFSVSGYLVAQSWDADPHVLRFAARRLLRIWPGLAAVVLLCALLWGPIISDLPVREYFRHPLVTEYLMNLAFSMRELLPVRFDGNALPLAINGPLWTIPLELKCYAALVLLGVAGLLRTKWWVIVLTTLLVLRYAVLEARGDNLVDSFGWSLEQRFLLEFGLFFAAGTVLHFFRLSKRWQSLALLGLSWVLGIAAIWLGRPLLGLWFIVPSTVVILGTSSIPVMNRVGRFGDLSYGLYIFAFPIQQTIIWVNHGRLSWVPLFLLTLFSCFLMAFASWHLVEKWALKLKPKRPASSRKIEPGSMVTAKTAGTS